MLNFTVFEQLIPFYEDLDAEQFEVILKSSYPYQRMMSEYECALLEVETKLKVLNLEFSTKKEGNPIENIKSRLKSPTSFISKLKRRNIPLTKTDIEENIFDIAGVRVICPFVDDVYRLIDSLKKQYDLQIFEEKDYIKNPKSNGYRSYHLIVNVPVFLYEQMIYRKVEIQFRTIGMDFWATIEHKIRYKKNIENTEYIQNVLYDCAKLSAQLDDKMRTVRNMILKQSNKIK